MKMIHHGFECQSYVADTHTAVAWDAARKLIHGGTPEKVVIVSTASPYKFNESVLTALGESIEGMDEFQLLDKLASINTRAGIPAGLASLKTAEILHSAVVEKQDMPKAVAEFAAKK